MIMYEDFQQLDWYKYLVDPVLEKLREEMRKKDPCDVCSYSPPSSMNGKPCALCPATARDDEEDANEMIAIADILMAIKSCEDRIKHLQSTPRHHNGKRKHERQVYLETIKLEALSLYLESLQEE